MAIGISEEVFWTLTPRKLKIYGEAHEKKLKEQDRQLWTLGAYFTNACTVAIDHTFGKGRSDYLEKPFSEREDDEYIDASDWSEEEKEEYRMKLFGYLGELQETHEKAEKVKVGS